MRFSERLAVTLGLAVLVIAAGGEAQATPNFPGAIQTHLTLGEAPPCTLCHLGTPGRGTVNTSFGATMRSRGLVAYDEASLGTALDALAAEQKDSDGDGTGDIRELRDGTDPNAGAGGSDTPVPEYGCNAAGRPGGASLLATLVLAALVVVGRRRARPLVRGPARSFRTRASLAVSLTRASAAALECGAAVTTAVGDEILGADAILGYARARVEATALALARTTHTVLIRGASLHPVAEQRGARANVAGLRSVPRANVAGLRSVARGR